MPRDRRARRDRHALNEHGMVLCNPRDKEAAHRADMGDVATGPPGSVTCPKCLDLLGREGRRSGGEELPEAP